MTSSSTQWYEAKVPPPVLGLAGLALQHRLAPSSGSSLTRRGIGLGVTGAAVTLMGSAASTFRRRGTTVDPLHPERAAHLVADGPFARTRNPMYLGMAAVLAAHAVARGGLLTWLPVAGFVAAIDRTQIPPEERALHQVFGQEYADYRSTVRRWV
jgi:protein-S-isoprenylcysteine O-methyltransferase Ste14